MKRPKGVYLLDPKAFEMVYGREERHEIAELAEIISPPLTTRSIMDDPVALAEAEVIFSGWGGPTLTDRFLGLAPALKVVFYGAGSVSSVATDDAWDRGIVISSAYAANAVPVAQYTLAMILFSLKHGWRLSRLTKDQRSYPLRDDAPGCYGSTVGLISLGMIGRKVLEYLAPFDFKVLVYDPYVTGREARQLGVERVSLEELFRRSDAVSVHTPSLEETEGLITGAHVAAMKPGAIFINTARGTVVCEPELLEVAAARPDLQFILDVAVQEPPEPDSPLYTLPNVVLTPHIAGSVGTECRRMGQYMVEELRRYVAGQPMRWVVTRDLAQKSCHRPVGRFQLGKAPAKKVPV